MRKFKVTIETGIVGGNFEEVFEVEDDATDEVITALAGTNEDVHPDDSKKMCELWDDLNDRHAPPVVVRELVRMVLAAMESEPVIWNNGCNKSVPAALRYLAENPRPIGGESSFNTAHLYQLAREIELMAEAPLYRHAQQPVVPDDVLEALQKVARIRLDLNEFDGDRRGIADCLGDAEEALIEVVNRRAAMLAAAPQGVKP